MPKQKTKKKEDSQIHLTRVWIPQKFILLFSSSTVRETIKTF